MSDAPAINPRDEAALLLARGLSTDEAGRRIGVNGSTVRRWRQDPDFADAVREARRAVFDEATGVLAALTKKAAITLGRAMDDDNPAIRVRASQVVLNAAPTLRQHTTLEDEIAELRALAAAAGLIPKDTQ